MKGALLLIVVSIAVSLAIGNAGLWLLNLCNPPVYYHDPSLGYYAVPNQWVATRGIRYHINQAGLRGRDFPDTKPPRTLRIVFVGDSVTFGGGVVSDADTFVARAAGLVGRRVGLKTDTVNISAPGWGVQNMDAYISRYGLYGGDLVVWILPHEDLRRPKNLAPGMPERRNFRILVLLSHISGILRSRVLGLGEENAYVPSHDVLRDNLVAFNHALELVKKSGAKAVVIFFPEREIPADVDQEAYRAYQASAAAHGVKTCDVCPLIKAAGGRYLFYDGAHLNARGHAVTGLLVAKCVSASLPTLGQAAQVRVRDRE